MSVSPEVKTPLHDKLVKIQGELKAPKSNENTFGKYKYRSCEDIMEAVKPFIKSENVTVTLSDDIWLCGNRTYVKSCATLSDGSASISTFGYAREEETKKGMDASQITGAASSYARKYALNGLFGIDDSADSDATNEGEDKTKTTAPPKKTAPPLNTPAAASPETIEQIGKLTGAMEYGSKEKQKLLKDHGVTSKNMTQKQADSILETLQKEFTNYTKK